MTTLLMLLVENGVLPLTDFIKKQAWKLSAIKGEPNLSILWEVRQIHLKKAISSQQATSIFTEVILTEKQFLPNCHFCQKAISDQKADCGWKANSGKKVISDQNITD